MQTLLTYLDGKKTYWAAGLILALLFGTWQGWWKFPAEIYEALMAAALIFLRLGVAKLQAQTPSAPALPAEPAAKP